MQHFVLYTLLTFTFTLSCLGQNFVEVEGMVGRIVPNYSDNFPASYPQSAIAIKYGKTNPDTLSWAQYYNYPETGIGIFLSNLGNNNVFGNQLNISPFINFKLKERENPFYLSFSLGVAFFDKYYNASDNLKNVSVSTPLTWAFQTFLYKTISSTSTKEYRLGLGFSHASNGHTQIPNFGLNSGLISFAMRIKNKDPELNFDKKVAKEQGNKHYFLLVRQGVGFHELGATAEPIGGPKREVYTASISGGVTINHHLKIRSGFSYRYYQLYRDYIQLNQPEYLKDHPNLNASNVYFFIGAELLMKHIGLDVAGGINLYKPFYPEYNTVFEKNGGLNYFLKRYLNTRMGLNFYLLNTNKIPLHNLSAGVHINANFGQADFTEFSLGYVLNLKN